MQSNVIFGFIFIAWLFFITARGELSVYLTILRGGGQQPSSASGSSSSSGGSVNGLGSILGGGSSSGPSGYFGNLFNGGFQQSQNPGEPGEGTGTEVGGGIGYVVGSFFGVGPLGAAAGDDAGTAGQNLFTGNFSDFGTDLETDADPSHLENSQYGLSPSQGIGSVSDFGSDGNAFDALGDA